VKFYRSVSACIIALAFFGTQIAARQVFAKEKDVPAKIVDSGSFGVFNGAHRVATETFSIKQDARAALYRRSSRPNRASRRRFNLQNLT
jgi:hypothetical protein